MDAAGDGEGEGSHVSVFIELMRGEFDSELNWPFQGSIIVTLLDQEGGQHMAETDCFTCDSSLPNECVCQIVGREKNLGWGARTFIAHILRIYTQIIIKMIHFISKFRIYNYSNE